MVVGADARRRVRTVQYHIGNAAPEFVFLLLPPRSFQNGFYFSSVLSRAVALACVGGLCPQINVSRLRGTRRLPYSDLACDWDGDGGGKSRGFVMMGQGRS